MDPALALFWGGVISISIGTWSAYISCTEVAPEEVFGIFGLISCPLWIFAEKVK